jgi:transposase
VNFRENGFHGLLYLPPYSPDLKAIGKALDAVGAKDA